MIFFEVVNRADPLNICLPFSPASKLRRGKLTSSFGSFTPSDFHGHTFFHGILMMDISMGRESILRHLDRLLSLKPLDLFFIVFHVTMIQLGIVEIKNDLIVIVIFMMKSLQISLLNIKNLAHRFRNYRFRALIFQL